ncbi:MAG TPA: DUF2786 domain-containing protein [Armatimonadota bacterium]|nr:DUF2786 domain-containing protein [Armatimonadota bacterium]
MLDNVKRQVAMLLEKTTANGCTVAEAESAAAAAQRLMSKHRIDAAELGSIGEDVEPCFDEDTLYQQGRICPSWRGVLAMYIGHANGVAVFQSGPSLRIVGTADQRAVVVYMFTYLARQVEELTLRLATGRGRSYSNSFRHGVVRAVGERLKAAEQVAKTEAPAGALVRIDKEDRALSLHMRSKYKLGTGTGARMGCTSGYTAGKAAGAGVSLHSALGGTTSRTQSRRLGQ